MKLLLEGDVAIVTGAAQGNGASLARGLAAAGARVALFDRNEQLARTVAEEINSSGGSAIALCVDVTEPEQCERASALVTEEIGPCSVLVNNAGIVERIAVGDERFPGSAARQYAVNCFGTTNMIRACLPQLVQTRGRIVNIASIASSVWTPGGVGYGASKGAVALLTKTLAVELADDGIRVNAVAPGVMSTPMTASMRENPDIVSRHMAHIPMRRFGDPEELIGPVVFLASRMSSYVTGAILPVDGGYLAC